MTEARITWGFHPKHHGKWSPGETRDIGKVNTNSRIAWDPFNPEHVTFIHRQEPDRVEVESSSTEGPILTVPSSRIRSITIDNVIYTIEHD